MDRMMNKETLMKRLADASQNKIYPLIIPRNELPLRKILLTTRLWNHVRRQQVLVSMSSNEWLNQQQDTPDTMGQQPENTCTDQPQKASSPLADDSIVSEQLSISENTQQSTDNIIATCDWPWFNEEAPKATLLVSLNEENNIPEEINQLPQIVHTSSSSSSSSGSSSSSSNNNNNSSSSSDLLSHELEDRKRPRYVFEEAEEEEKEDEQEKSKKTKKINNSQHEDDILCSSSSLNHHNSLHFSLDAPASPAGPASPPPTAPNSPPVLLSA